MPLPIPDYPEAITAEWLTAAVAERHPGSRAERVEIVDAHSGTTGRVRLRATWNAGASAPAALFAKLPPTDPLQREMVVSTGMGRREAHFYAELARDVPVRVPAPIWSGWREDGSAYLMLMEDLAEAGCSFATVRDDGGLAHALGMVDTLAALHGHYWESPRFDADLAWLEPPMRGEIGPLLVREAVRQFAGEMPAAFKALADLYLAHTDALNDLLDEGPATLLHGDSHSGNTFLEGSRVGLLDWACTCRAPGLRDVAYYLCSSIPTELRRAQERALLRRYLDGLAASGGKPPEFDTAWLGYRRYLVCGWIAATVTAAAGSRMQPIEIGLASMQRATAAIAEHGTETLLRDALGV